MRHKYPDELLADSLSGMASAEVATKHGVNERLIRYIKGHYFKRGRGFVKKEIVRKPRKNGKPKGGRKNADCLCVELSDVSPLKVQAGSTQAMLTNFGVEIEGKRLDWSVVDVLVSQFGK